MANVFISSTGKDLTAYRQAAIEVCLRLGGLSPIAMEFFEAMGKGARRGPTSSGLCGFFKSSWGMITRIPRRCGDIWRGWVRRARRNNCNGISAPRRNCEARKTDTLGCCGSGRVVAGATYSSNHGQSSVWSDISGGEISRLLPWLT